MRNSIPMAVSGHNFFLLQGILECRITGRMGKVRHRTRLQKCAQWGTFFFYFNVKLGKQKIWKIKSSRKAASLQMFGSEKDNLTYTDKISSSLPQILLNVL